MKIEVAYSNPSTKEIFEVTGAKIVFGRSLNANVTIKREEMSRYHFQIDVENGRYFITDLNSSNGVFIDGKKIPANQKIPYNLVFPIEIAHQISISLSPSAEEEEYIPFEIPTKAEDASPIFENKLTDLQTSTLQIERKELSKSKSKPPIKKDSVKEKKKQTLSPTIILPLLVILVVPVYIYFGQDKIEVNETTESIDTKSPEVTQAPAAVPKFQAGELSYQNLIQQNNCNELGSICKTIGLNHPKEGIALSNNKMIVFINLDFVPAGGTHQKFKELPDKVKAEYYMAMAGSHAILTEELKKRKSTHLLIVGFIPIDTDVRFKYLLNISFDQLPPLNEDLHQYLFNQMFYTGSFRLYKEYVGYYTEFSEL